VKEDLQVLVDFAQSEKWPKEQIRFLREFLADNDVEEAGDSNRSS
jgi:hypothetical protein